MSQNSKVSTYVREGIINALMPTPEQKALILAGRASLPTASNVYLFTKIFTSLRTIQEATQKLAAEGILVKQGRGVYSLSAVAAGIATAASASN